MSRIILIETSTSLCSTALAEDGKVISYKESNTPRSHAAMTAAFVGSMLKEHGLKVGDCDAVAVSEGPGSYTGLRVGSSTAKGLCFGASIPLIAISTLDTLVAQAKAEGLVDDSIASIIPMIDARRMEVYTAAYTPSGGKVCPTTAMVLRQTSYSDIFQLGKALIIGDGAGKCAELFGDKAVCVQCCPKASSMAAPAAEAWEQRKLADTAYFEPFYLKDFIATVSKKIL